MLRIGRVGRRAAEWGWRGCGEGLGVLGEVAQSRTLGQSCAHKSCRREGPSRKTSKRRIALRKPAHRGKFDEGRSLDSGPQPRPALAKQAAIRSNCAVEHPDAYLGPQPDKFQLNFSKEKNTRETKCAASTEKINKPLADKPIIHLDHEIQTINYQLRHRSWLPKQSQKQVAIYHGPKPISRWVSPVKKTKKVHSKPEVTTEYQSEVHPRISVQEMLRDRSLLKYDRWRRGYNYKDAIRRLVRNNVASSSSIKDIKHFKNSTKEKSAYSRSIKPANSINHNAPENTLKKAQKDTELKVSQDHSKTSESVLKCSTDIVRKVSSIGDFITEKIKRKNITKDWLANKFYSSHDCETEPDFSLDTKTIENNTHTTTSIKAVIPKSTNSSEVNSKIFQLNKTLEDIRKRLEEWKISSKESSPRMNDNWVSVNEELKERKSVIEFNETQSLDKNPDSKENDKVNEVNEVNEVQKELNNTKIVSNNVTLLKNSYNYKPYIPNSLASNNFQNPWKIYMEQKPQPESSFKNKENKFIHTILNEPARKNPTFYKKYDRSKSAEVLLNYNKQENQNHRRLKAAVRRFPSHISFAEADKFMSCLNTGRTSPNRSSNQCTNKFLKQNMKITRPRKIAINNFDFFDLSYQESPLQTIKEKLISIRMTPTLNPLSTSLLKQTVGIKQMRWLSTKMFVSNESQKNESEKSLHSVEYFKNSEESDKKRKEKALQTLFSRVENVSQGDPDDKESQLQRKNETIVTENKDKTVDREENPIYSGVKPHLNLVKESATSITKKTLMQSESRTTYKSEKALNEPSKWVVYKSSQPADDDKLSERNIDRRLKNVSKEVRETQERIQRIRENLKREKEIDKRKACVNVADVGIGLSGIGAVLSPDKEEDALREQCFHETISKIQGKDKSSCNKHDLPSPGNGGIFVFSPEKSLKPVRKGRIELAKGILMKKHVLTNHGKAYSTFKENQDIQIHTYDSKDDSLTEKPNVVQCNSEKSTHQPAEKLAERNELDDCNVAYEAREQHRFPKPFSNFHRNALTDVNKLESGRDPHSSVNTKKYSLNPESNMRPTFVDNPQEKSGRASSQKPDDSYFFGSNASTRTVIRDKSPGISDQIVFPTSREFNKFVEAGDKTNWINRDPRLKSDQKPVSQRGANDDFISKKSIQNKFETFADIEEKTKGEIKYEVELDDVTGQRKAWKEQVKNSNEGKSNKNVSPRTKQEGPIKQVMYKINMNKTSRGEQLSYNSFISENKKTEDTLKKRIKIRGRFETSNNAIVMARPIYGSKREDNEYTMRQVNIKKLEKMRPRFEVDSHIVKMEVLEKQEEMENSPNEDINENEEIRTRSFSEKKHHIKERRKIYEEICKTIFAMKSDERSRKGFKDSENISPLENKLQNSDKVPNKTLSHGDQGFFEQLNSIVQEQILDEKVDRKDEVCRTKSTNQIGSEENQSNKVQEETPNEFVQVSGKEAEGMDQSLIPLQTEGPAMKEIENQLNIKTPEEKEMLTVDLSPLDVNEFEMIMIEKNDMSSEHWPAAAVGPVAEESCAENLVLYSGVDGDRRSEKRFSKITEAVINKFRLKEDVEKIEAIRRSGKQEKQDFTTKLLDSLNKESKETMEHNRPQIAEKARNAKKKVIAIMEKKVLREINKLENERQFEELRNKMASDVGSGDSREKGPWTARLPEGALQVEEKLEQLPDDLSISPEEKEEETNSSKDPPKYKMSTTTAPARPQTPK